MIITVTMPANETRPPVCDEDKIDQSDDVDDPDDDHDDDIGKRDEAAGLR